MNRPAPVIPAPAQDVLLTGATSEIGMRVIQELGHRPDVPRIFVLARRRLRSFPRSVAGIRADITQPATLRAAADQLRAATFQGTVIHLAANTNFFDESACYAVNYEGTLQWLAALRNVPGLRRFVYVSTAMNCGIQPGGLIREDDPLPLERERHLTAYTHSKALVEDALAKTAWPFEIRTLRPSIMLGCAADLPPLRDNLFWALKAFYLIGVAPLRRTSGIDALPLDVGARLLAQLALKPACRHAKYLVAAGVPRTQSFHEFTTRIEDHLRAGGRAAHLQYLELPGYDRDWAAARAELSAPVRKLAGALWQHYRFIDLNIRFDPARMLQELALAPADLPSYFAALPTLARYWDRVRVSPRTMAIYI